MSKFFAGRLSLCVLVSVLVTGTAAKIAAFAFNVSKIVSISNDIRPAVNQTTRGISIRFNQFVKGNISESPDH